MYRDNKLGLCVDLSGPDGNTFFLVGHAQQLCSQLNWPHEGIVSEMMSGDYQNALQVFEDHFGQFVTMLNIPEGVEVKPHRLKTEDAHGAMQGADEETDVSDLDDESLADLMFAVMREIVRREDHGS